MRRESTKVVITVSVLVEIPGYLFCIFVMDCWGRRPILSFCQVCHIRNAKNLNNHSNYFKAMSGVACIICGLLQGTTDPGLKGLQVSWAD